VSPQVNWIAIIVCAVIGMVVPALWYAPKLFGKAWMELEGLTEEKLKQNGAALAVAALSSLLMSFGTAMFLQYFGSETFVQGALAGLQLWLVYSAATLVTDYRFAQRPWKLTFINIGHSALVLALMGGILAAWK